MTDEKIQSIDLRKKAAERIKIVRSMAGYAERKAFCLRFKFPLATLEAWERGKNPLTLKGAMRLIDVLSEVGIYCSEEWLRLGTGISPRPFEEISEGVHTNFSLTINSLEKNLKIAKEISTFITLNEGAAVTIVRDDAMLPFYEKGDYVGGIKRLGPSLKEAINKRCIIEFANGQTAVRQLYKGKNSLNYNISAINLSTKKIPINEHDIDIISAAPIIWHRSLTK
ncbi:MAG: hypothetical protein K2W92_04800 [Alphaproteobacteria bacterium]|nr:hypothetical protein [Alphaproteobacteria bacterium]